MTEKEALKLALEFIERINKDGWILADFEPQMYETMNAIKEALAQPEPWEKFCDSNCVWTDHHPDCKLAEQSTECGEPVAFSCLRCVTPKKCAIHGCSPNTWPSETPPQRKPLTENEIKHLWYEACQTNLELTSQLIVHLARNIEAAHGIKGEA